MSNSYYTLTNIYKRIHKDSCNEEREFDKLCGQSKRYTTNKGTYLYIGKSNDGDYMFYLLKGWYNDLEHKTGPRFNGLGETVYKTVIYMKRTKTNTLKPVSIGASSKTLLYDGTLITKEESVQTTKKWKDESDRQVELIKKIIRGDTIDLKKSKKSITTQTDGEKKIECGETDVEIGTDMSPSAPSK